MTKKKPWVIEAVEKFGPMTSSELFQHRIKDGHNITNLGVRSQVSRLCEDGRLKRLNGWPIRYTVRDETGW